jgi:hypothetical protein
MQIVLSERPYIGGGGSSSLFYQDDFFEIFKGRFGKDNLFDVKLINNDVNFVVLNDHPLYSTLLEFKEDAYPFDKNIRESDSFKSFVKKIQDDFEAIFNKELCSNLDLINKQFYSIEAAEENGFDKGVEKQQLRFRKILFGYNCGEIC